MKYLACLLAVLLIPVASALTDAQLQRYDPTPAQPGDLLTVEIALVNEENNAARGVELELLPSGTITPEGRSTVRAGTIAARSSYIATLQVRVDADAPAGEAVLRMRVREQGSDWQERTGDITIQPSEAGVLIASVQVQPESISPGASSTITLEVQNNANSLLREVSTQLELEDTPFVPAQSTTRKRVGDLGSGEDVSVVYELSAEPDAEAGIYRVPVTLSFLDRNGNTVEQQDMIGLSISTQQRTSAHIDNVEATASGAQISVRIINKGLSEIKFLEAEVQEQEGFSIPEQERVSYLGNVDSDDWQTMRFNVVSSQDQIQIPISYTYQDAFNQPHNEEQVLTVSLPKQQSGGLSGTVLVVIVILLIGGYWLYRKKKSKR